MSNTTPQKSKNVKKKKVRDADGQGTENSVEKDQLPINTDFAKRYETAARRKLLNSAPAALLEDSEGSSSSSEEEDEFGELLTKGIDRRVRDTLHAIRKKDPRIYDKDVKFFNNQEEQSSEGEKADEDGDGGSDDHDSDEEVDSDDEPVAGWDTIAAAAEKATPKLTLKDYIRENLLKDGKLSDGESEDDESEDERANNDKGAAADEHTEAKPQLNFSRSEHEKDDDGSSKNDSDRDGGEDDGNDSDDDFFTKRTKTKEELDEEERDFQAFLTKETKRKSQKTGDDLLLHSYLERETPDEKERFLRDFVLNNGWLDKNKGDAPRADDYGIEVDLPQQEGSGSEDGNKSEKDEMDDFEDRNDAFEAEYNFRFEEEGAEHIATHARSVPDSMRRPDERRKLARKAKRERKKRERDLKVEELKRLKNEKKREIQARLLAIREAAGDDVDVKGLDLDGDFDPDKFNAEMEGRFGDDYYAREDDAIQGEFKEGVTPEGEKRLQTKEAAEASEEVQRNVEQMMDEYYNLDFEDIVGGKPMRFSYKKVEPESFGMSTEDILSMDDKELNRTVSLKYLAPYRSRRDVQKQAWKVRDKLNKRKRSVRTRKAVDTQDNGEEIKEEVKDNASQRKRKKRKKVKQEQDVDQGSNADMKVKTESGVD